MFVICIRFLTNYVLYIVVNSNRFYLPYFIQSKYWWIFNISIPFSTRTVNGTLSACQSSPLVLSLHWTFLILEVNGIRVVNLCAVWKGLIVCSVCIDFYLKLTIHLILFRTIKKKQLWHLAPLEYVISNQCSSLFLNSYFMSCIFLNPMSLLLFQFSFINSNFFYKNLLIVIFNGHILDIGTIWSP